MRVVEVPGEPEGLRFSTEEPEDEEAVKEQLDSSSAATAVVAVTAARSGCVVGMGFLAFGGTVDRELGGGARAGAGARHVRPHDGG
ncbi:hypothetical protein GCM10027168_02310 [Streptomyces capparidis]